MTYGTIPHLSKPISKLIMGIIPLPQNDLPRAFSILDAYRAAGGNAIDNSRVYGNGYAGIMRAYYEQHGQDALIRIDKGNHHKSNDDAGRRVTKADLDADIKANLEHQEVDYSDIYLLHRDDERVPAGDVVEWLNEQVAAGRIKAFGGSNWKHWRIEEANEYAEKHGMQGFSVSSPNLSLAIPNEPMWWEALTISDDPKARAWYHKTGLPVFAWSAGGGGFFAGVDSDPVRRVYHNETNFKRKERLDAMAAQKQVTPTQLALAWTLNQPLNIWALIGPASREQVHDNVKSTDIKLDQEELDYLENG